MYIYTYIYICIIMMMLVCYLMPMRWVGVPYAKMRSCKLVALAKRPRNLRRQEAWLNPRSRHLRNHCGLLAAFSDGCSVASSDGLSTASCSNGCALLRVLVCNGQGGEKVRTAEEVRRYEHEPPSEPIQFMTDYFLNRHETVQVLRYEYETPCPPPYPAYGGFCFVCNRSNHRNSK